MKRPSTRPHTLLALAIAAVLPGVAAGDTDSTIKTYAAGTGALSYTFFNLSGDNCTATAYGYGANPYAALWGQLQGWGNSVDSFWSSYYGVTGGYPAFFNPIGLGPQFGPGDKGGFYRTVGVSYLFFNQGPPLDSASIPAQPQMISPGASQSAVITSTQLGPSASNQSVNYPAMGDSWSLACAAGGATYGAALASLGSAASALQSGGPTAYPYDAATPGWFENAALNPTAESGTMTAWTCSSTAANPCGAGFTNGPQSARNDLVFNWNLPSGQPNYQPMGGLWSGIHNNPVNGAWPAPYTLNYAMLPVNFSAYVQGQSGNWNPNDTSQVMTYTPVYGGHFAVAVGDPYIISSFAAKMLWSLVISPSFTLGDGALNSGTLLPSISNALAGSVFPNTSTPDNYVRWLLDDTTNPSAVTAAAKAFRSSFQAASVPITEVSAWGEILEAAANLAVNTATSAMSEALDENPLAKAMFEGTVDTAEEYLVPAMDNAIINGSTSQISPAAPLSQAAPPVYNPTFSSGNLLGLWMANTLVQAGINHALGTASGPSPLWSNYSINTQGLCKDISIQSNLFNGVCGPGQTINGNAGQQSASNPPAYQNVLTLGLQTTRQFSVWNAILTGADVTTDGNGYIALGEAPAGASTFSPPTQMWNATNGAAAPTTPLPAGLGVDTTFNLQTGMLTAPSYSLPYAGIYNAALLPRGTSSPPATQPGVTLVIDPNGGTYNGGITPWAISYSARFGSLTVWGYQANSAGPGGSPQSQPYAFSNGVQTIDLTTCPGGSDITLSVSLPAAASGQNPAGASGSLSCQPPAAPAAPQFNVGVNTNGSTFDGAITLPSGNLPGGTSPPYFSYSPATGVLTVSGYAASNPGRGFGSSYFFANGPLTLDTTTCPPDASALLTVTLPSTASPTNAWGATGSLSCQVNVTLASPPILDYSACVKDPWAAGGVLAAFTAVPDPNTGNGGAVALACACLPAYLNGPDPTTVPAGNLLGGVVVGATSSAPQQSCPRGPS